MIGKRIHWGYLVVLVTVLLTAASGWGMNREAVSDRLTLCTENNRVDLGNPFFQGNFGYRYPLELPDGINGLEPALAFVYNSELTTEKFLGSGWELSGYNQIRRNNREGVPWFDSRDTFILTLNGKEYGFDAAGNIEGGTLQVEGSATAGWHVYEPDGTELTFTAAATTNKGTFCWVLSKMTDTNGNTVTYAYDTSLLEVEGVAYLDTIIYSDSLQVERSIRFIYEANGHTAGQDPTLHYREGRKTCYSRRLKTVAAGMLTYTLEYKNGTFSGCALLAGIQPSIGDPVAFTYQSETSSATPWEFTSQGALSFLNDYVRGTSSANLYSYDALIRDFNRDGLPDLLVLKHRQGFSAGVFDVNVDYLPEIYLNNGNGGWAVSHDFLSNRSDFSNRYYHIGDNMFDLSSSSYTDLGIDQNLTPLVYDINGNGSQDLLLVGQYEYTALERATGITKTRWSIKEYVVYLNDGSGNFSFKEKRTETGSGSGLIPDYLDLNDDGVTDSIPFRAATMPIVVDINGDRFPDFYSKGAYYTNQGDATFQSDTVPREQELYFRGKRTKVDLNGDGVVETVTYDNATRQLTCSDSRYDLVLPENSLYCNSLNSYIRNVYVNELFADFNGDGYPDLLTLGGVYLNTGKPDLLTKISGAEEISVGYERWSVASTYSNRPDKKAVTVSRWAVSSITADGETTTFGYDGGLHDLLRREFRGYREITVKSPEGSSVYTYQPEDRTRFGLVANVSGPEGSVAYQYSFTGTRLSHLKTVSQPVNGPETVVDNDYDSDGNLTEQVQQFSDGGVAQTTIKTYEYAKSGHIRNALKRSAASGTGLVPAENLYYYDGGDHGGVSKGNLTRIDSLVKPDGTGSADLTVNLSYDSHGIATGVADAAGNTTTTGIVAVDSDHTRRITRNALGHESSELIENATGLTLESVDANGAKTTYEYDPDRRLQRVTRPDGGYTEYEYQKTEDGGSIAITRTRERGSDTILLWQEERSDKTGNVVETVAKRVKAATVNGTVAYELISGPVYTAKTYNRRGQVVSESLPYFQDATPRWVQYEYEEENPKHRVVKATQPDGAVTRYEYDDGARTAAVIDPRGARTETAERYEQAEIEGRGGITCRIVSMNGPAGLTESYYDLNGNLLQTVDPQGKAKVYWYDSLGRVYRSRDPYKGQISYLYDQNGRLAQQTDAKAQVIAYRYDAINRLTAKALPGNRKIEWLYDLTGEDDPLHTYGIGRLGAYQDSSGTTRLGYDSAGNLTKKVRGEYTLSFDYDMMDRVTGVTYPDQSRVAYEYDLLGLAQVTRNTQVIAEFSERNALGQAGTVTYGNEVRNSFDFNPDNGWLTQIQSTSSRGTLLNLSYSFDPNGNITGVSDGTAVSPQHPAALDEVYTYDPANRLLTAAGVNGSLSYSYDEAGNFKTKEGVTYTYGDSEHPYAPTAGSSGFKASYDANGNMVAKTDAYGNDLVLTYDEENQLTRVQKNGNYTESYTYDATGYRVGRAAGGVQTDYVYWGNSLLYEITSGRAIDYVWAEGKLLAKVETTGTTYFHHDHLGSSKLQTDDSGNVVSSDVTQPFGPRICAAAVKDELTTADGVNTVASTAVIDTTNGVVKAPHGENGYQTGELYTTELKPGVDARVVKLGWTGSGVTFYVSTDGNTWSQLQKDQPLSLGTSTRSLYLKAVLAADASSVLDRYLLQINPTGFNLFTGKMLTEETGLVYFGARWYDPEIGRWITPDPAEDGENWYSYCGNNPVNYTDPDGNFRTAAQALWLLTGPVTYVWDTLKGMADFVSFLTPYPYLPMPINMAIVSVEIARSVFNNPVIVLDVVKDMGYGLVEDIIDTIKNFPKVVLGKPTNAEVRAYGKSLTGTVLTVVAIAKTVKAVQGANAAIHTTNSVSKLNLQFFASKNNLVAGEAGAYDDLLRRSIRGDKLTPHHMPQAGMGFTSKGRGGALAIPESEHFATRTFGWNGVKALADDAGLSFRQILAKDIRDMRNIAKSVHGTTRYYNKGLINLMKYWTTNFTDLLLK
jgi:RHS repeat-associated protein